ncbi:hypothetical protein [Promicromonospora sukumoe]
MSQPPPPQPPLQPPQPAQPAQPPLQPPLPGFDAVLSFTVQGNILTSNMIAPTLTVDGWPAPLPVTGTRRIPIRSGRHRLQVYSQWLRRYGHAVLDVDVAPGQTLEVFYAPPHQNFYDEGAIGLSPQVRRGRGVVIAVWTMIGLLLAMVCGSILAVTISLVTLAVT